MIQEIELRIAAEVERDRQLGLERQKRRLLWQQAEALASYIGAAAQHVAQLDEPNRAE